MKDRYLAVLVVAMISAGILVAAEYTYSGIERRERIKLSPEEKETYTGPLAPSIPADPDQYRLVHLGITLGMIVCVLIGTRPESKKPRRRDRI